MDQVNLGVPNALEKCNPKPGYFSLLSEPQAHASAQSISTEVRVQLAKWVGVRQDSWGSVSPLQPPQVPANLYHHLRSSLRATETEDPLSVALRSFDFGNFESFWILAQKSTTYMSACPPTFLSKHTQVVFSPF